jgi:putative membrane protein
MTTRTESFLKALVLAASGLMLYQKIASGTIAFYINQRFQWLVLAGALIYLLLALTLLYKLVMPAQQSLVRQMLGPAQSTFTSWSAVLLLALPALIGAIAPARPLGAGAIESRGIGLQSAPAAAGGATTLKRAPSGPRTILDWLREISTNGDPAAIAGQQADVIGFVYRDDLRFAKNQFMVSRFTVSCCVADASALGLIVESDQLAQFKQDQWVRVVGRFSTGAFANETVPIIKADTIEATEQPNAPYLYP